MRFFAAPACRTFRHIRYAMARRAHEQSPSPDLEPLTTFVGYDFLPGMVNQLAKATQSTLFLEFSRLVELRLSCLEKGDDVDAEGYEAQLHKLAETRMPNGAGFDSGTRIDLEQSRRNKLVFHTDYHHMNDSTRTAHTVTVSPFIQSFRIGGPNKDGIKQVIQDAFQKALNQVVS